VSVKQPSRGETPIFRAGNLASRCRSSQKHVARYFSCYIAEHGLKAGDLEKQLSCYISTKGEMEFFFVYKLACKNRKND